MSRDPWHRVAFGAVADASDKPGLATVKSELHDQLIEWADREGFTRAGPVVWRWWPARKAPQMLADMQHDPDEVRRLMRFCAQHPDGLLVCASVEIDDGRQRAAAGGGPPSRSGQALAVTDNTDAAVDKRSTGG